MTILLQILAALGGLAGIITLLQFFNTRKSDKMKGQAEAAALVQSVYKDIIDDLTRRQDELEARIKKFECRRKRCKIRINEEQ